MIKLSQRLQVIADYINQGETMADIGTDHGFLPIYLRENRICPYVILSDINKGPLEKAKENIKAYCPNNTFDIRLGSGIKTLSASEVDIIVIAGMGGILITDILSEDIEKTKSYKKIILQPRNAPDKLKKWLLENGFVILDEILVRESKYIWEIILTAHTNQLMRFDNSDFSFTLNKDDIIDDMDYEINPILFDKKDQLLIEYIQNKIRIEEKIIREISSANQINDHEKLNSSKERILNLKIKLKEASKHDE